MQLPHSPQNQVSSLVAPLALPRTPIPEEHIKVHGKHWTPVQEILPECFPIACLEPSHTWHIVLCSLSTSSWLPLWLFPRVELVMVPQTLGTTLRFCKARPRHHLSSPNMNVFLKKKAGAQREQWCFLVSHLSNLMNFLMSLLWFYAQLGIIDHDLGFQANLLAGREWPEKITYIYYHVYYISVNKSISILVSAGVKSVPWYSSYDSTARLFEFKSWLYPHQLWDLYITIYLLWDLRQELHPSETFLFPHHFIVDVIIELMS